MKEKCPSLYLTKLGNAIIYENKKSPLVRDLSTGKSNAI
jgi:hypothetical protein